MIFQLDQTMWAAIFVGQTWLNIVNFMWFNLIALKKLS